MTFLVWSGMALVLSALLGAHIAPAGERFGSAVATMLWSTPVIVLFGIGCLLFR